MSDSIQNIGGELVAQMMYGSTLNYEIDWTPDLAPGEVINAATWSVDGGGVTVQSMAFTDTTTTATLSGGLANTWYIVEVFCSSALGLTHGTSIRLFIAGPEVSDLGAGLWLPFPNIPSALASIRRDRLANLIANYLPPGTAVADSFLLEKLVAASALVARQLRVFLVPTQVLPNTVSQDEIDAVTDKPVYLEPAYDYDPSFFQGNTWGRTLTRQRPIIAVQSMGFVYPSPSTVLYQIPIEWVRLDKKYGVINLLPIQNSATLPLNAFILNALGGGRTIPNFIDIRYTAGLENAARDYPDLLDVIIKQTVLGIAEDLYTPSSRSQSVSADGLSQSESISFQIGEYSKQIDAKLSSIKSSLSGIPMWSV